MSDYNFRQVEIDINGTKTRCLDLSLSLSASPAAILPRVQKYSNTFNATDYVERSIGLSYPIIGTDPLLGFTTLDNTGFSGNIGGLYFKSGYLTSYSLAAEPNGGLNANASILVVDPLQGNIAAGGQNYPYVKVANARNIAIGASGFNLGQDNILGFDYSYSQTILPLRISRTENANQVYFGPKRAEVGILTDSVTGVQSASGEPIRLTVDIKAENGNVLNSILVKGVVTSKELKFTSEDYVVNSYRIIQADLSTDLSFSGFNPTSGYFYETVNFSGVGMGETLSITFNNVTQSSLTKTNQSQLYCQVPYGAVSGSVYLNTSISTYNVGTFNVLDSGIVISTLTPISGSYYL